MLNHFYLKDPRTHFSLPEQKVKAGQHPKGHQGCGECTFTSLARGNINRYNLFFEKQWETSMRTQCDLSGYRIDYSVTCGKRSTWDDGNCFETRLMVSVQGCCGLFKLAHLMPGEHCFQRPATVSSHRFLPTKEDMYKVTKELKSSCHLVTSQQS